MSTDTNKNTIRALPKDLIEKIAAGEVVERPASVVKELVENAIDAGATKIDIVLEKAGTALIKIKDNGSGMTKENLERCVLAHTTSKIKEDSDLFAITTLGFRGEALSSICAVSEVTIQTNATTLEGFSLSVRGGILSPIVPVAQERGTTILVENVFFNVPARRKFLKSEQVELQAILAIVEAIVLSHPQIDFTVTHNNKLLLKSPSSNLVTTFSDIYGSQIQSQHISIADSIDFSRDDVSQPTNSVHTGAHTITIKGIISHPAVVRADKKGMHIFVNGRVIKNTSILNAIIEGYNTLLMVGKFPHCALFLELDASQIDVNVHPRKDIIKIERESELLAHITQIITKQLYAADLLRNATISHLDKDVPRETQNVQSTIQSLDTMQDATEIDSQNEVRDTFSTTAANSMAAQNTSNSEYSSSHTDKHTAVESTTPIHNQNKASANSRTSITELTQSVLHETPHVAFEHRREESSHPQATPTDAVRYIGIIHKTYVVCEDKHGLLLVDFHAAHERYNYEQLMDQLYNNTLKVQSLLEPLVVELTPHEYALAIDNRDNLDKWGFSIDSFGEQTIIVRTIPNILGRSIQIEYIKELLSQLHEGRKNSLEELQQMIITRMSCKASDRAGDDISSERAKALIRFAIESKMKYACPHGRPIFIRLSLSELEKLFKRRA